MTAGRRRRLDASVESSSNPKNDARLTDRPGIAIPLDRPSYRISFVVEEDAHPRSFHASAARREELVLLDDGEAWLRNEVGGGLRDWHDRTHSRVDDRDPGVGFQVGDPEGWMIVASEERRRREGYFLETTRRDRREFQAQTHDLKSDSP